MELEQDECDRIIKVYRETYPEIPALWREAGRALNSIMKDQSSTFGRPGILEVEGNNGIRLPNGLYIKYPELRKETDEEGKTGYCTRPGRVGRLWILEYMEVR